MTERSVVHCNFTIERIYDAAPARVFAAFASKEAKQTWCACDDEWETIEFELDFRVGGREINRNGPKGGTVHVFNGIYQDIVPNERIIIGFDMHLDARKISVSLITIEFKPAGKGTRLLFTEQGVFLDGYDDIAGREHGTGIGLDNLEKYLQREMTKA